MAEKNLPKPRISKRITIPAKDVGITLTVSEKAMREIREMEAKAALEAANAPVLLFR